MSDLIATPVDATALATLDAELAAEAKTIATALAGANTITTANGQFKFPDGTTVRGPLHMVVLAGRITKQLWNKAFDAKDSVGERGLLCAATGGPDLDRNSLIPYAGAVDPQNDKCAGCPQNHWQRQGPKSVKVGDCKDGFLFAVMFANLETAASNQIFLIRGSATGVTEAVKVMQELKTKFGHPVRGLVAFDHVPAGGAMRVSASVVGPNPFYHQHAAHRFAAEEAVIREPRWYEEASEGAPVGMPVVHAPVASAGRARSLAAAVPA